jgi:hypothetical protein
MRIAPRRALALLLGMAASLAASCSEEAGARGELVVVCHWSGLAGEDLRVFGAEYDTTPTLTRWASSALDKQDAAARKAPLTSQVASLLCGVGSELHGLLSLAEPGHESITMEVETVAERARRGGWRTLAAVSHAKYTVAGLGRGFDLWRAPELGEGQRDAAQVWASIEENLAAELERAPRVFVWLEFGDLWGDEWTRSDHADSFLDKRLQSFRGKGGAVDDAYAASDEERSLVQRLKRRLFRQGGGRARTELEASLIGARLGQLDGVLANLEDLARDTSAKLDWAVVCGDLRLASAGAGAVFPATNFGQEVPPGRQSIAVESAGRGDLSVSLNPLDGSFSLLGDGGQASSRGASLEGPGNLVFELSQRGTGLRLVLQGPACTPEGVRIGSTSLADSDICELQDKHGVDWPVDPETVAILEVRSLGGRRERVIVATGGEVRLLIEYFPPNRDLWTTLEGQGLEISEHATRADCVEVRGAGPFEFDLPARVPRERLGLALFVAGERVPAEQINYRGQRFAVRGRLELLFSPGIWLAPELCAAVSDSAVAPIAIELLDPVARSGGHKKQPRAERAFLRRLDPSE